MSGRIIRQILFACGVFGVTNSLQAAEPIDGAGNVTGTPQEEAQIPSFSAHWLPDLEHLHRQRRASYKTGNYGPTIAASKALLARIGRESGENSTDFASALEMHASLLLSAGRPADAKPLVARALSLSDQLFGERHPQTLRCIHRYAFTLRRLGETERAAQFFELALRLRVEVLGAADGQTMITRINYAHTLFGLDRLEAAAAVYQEAFQLSERTFGAKHSLTNSSRNGYAATLRRLGRKDEGKAGAGAGAGAGTGLSP